VPERCGACLNCALNDEALIVMFVCAMGGLGGLWSSRRCAVVYGRLRTATEQRRFEGRRYSWDWGAACPEGRSGACAEGAA
jgi:hypothetical protein